MKGITLTDFGRKKCKICSETFLAMDMEQARMLKCRRCKECLIVPNNVVEKLEKASRKFAVLSLIEDYSSMTNQDVIEHYIENYSSTVKYTKSVIDEARSEHAEFLSILNYVLGLAIDECPGKAIDDIEYIRICEQYAGNCSCGGSFRSVSNPSCPKCTSTETFAIGLRFPWHNFEMHTPHRTTLDRASVENVSPGKCKNKNVIRITSTYK